MESVSRLSHSQHSIYAGCTTVSVRSSYAKEIEQEMSIIFSNVFMNLVRADGAAKQSMIANLLGTAVNFAFDPIFILALR